MKTLLLSVIIPAHGREELLIRCLVSLDSDIQKDCSFEVCVVDDGSVLDEQGVRKRVSAHYPLIWRAFASPRGRSAARNEGIRSTSGDTVVFLDSDMETRNGFINAHITYHREHARTAVIGHIKWPKGGSFLRYIGSRGAGKLRPDNDVPPWYFVTGNASIERCDLPSGSPFDETLSGWGGEDLDLGMRLHAAGVKFMYAPEAVSVHHFTGDLAGHVHRTTLYGRYALPVLVKRHPELVHILRLDLMNSRLWRMAVHKFFSLPVFWAARGLDPFPLPLFLFDYLTFATYARGWLKGKQS